MAHRWLLLSLLLTLLLTACERLAPPGPEQREAASRAERDRQDLQRCRRDQGQLRQQLTALERSGAALEQLRRSYYSPTPRPQAPDPNLAKRYSVTDQELDTLRYSEELERWRQQESDRYDRWLQGHRSELERLQALQREQRRSLRALNSSLFDPAKPDQLRPAVVRKYSDCQAPQFGAAAGS